MSIYQNQNNTCSSQVLSKWYQDCVPGIKMLDDKFAGKGTRPDLNRTIYDDTNISSCHKPYTLNIFHPVSSYEWFRVTGSPFRRVISMSFKTRSSLFQYMRDMLKKMPQMLLMTGENSLNFVNINKEICLMKCNTFFEDQCCTCCFDSEGKKYWMPLVCSAFIS